MKNLRLKSGYFTKGELTLWGLSNLIIILSFILFDRSGYMVLLASLIGASSLILCAKGNPLGQLLIVVFSIIYGAISYQCAYYGEMATYLGMTAPMALFSLISWLRNPYNGNRSQVKVNRIGRREVVLIAILAAAVTFIFYFILKSLNTANLPVSTISVTTSFIPVYLTMRRSAFYALGYAANDVVLIILWTMASLKDISYISVTICFIMFFINDIYGFINWRRMDRKQNSATAKSAALS